MLAVTGAALKPLATLPARLAQAPGVAPVRWLPPAYRGVIAQVAWLAPSQKLLRAYHARQVTWPQFCQWYARELAPLAARIAAWRASQPAILTLYCFEDDAPEATIHCHRRLLASYLTTGEWPTA